MRNTKLEGHLRGKRERITDKSSARILVLRKEDNISSKYLHHVCGNKQKTSHTSLYHLQLALTPNCHQVSTCLPINIWTFLTHTKTNKQTKKLNKQKNPTNTHTTHTQKHHNQKEKN